MVWTRPQRAGGRVMREYGSNGPREHTMSPLNARAVSMALLGGIAAALFYAVGLLDWTAFMAWGIFLAAGGDTPALKKVIPAMIFGVFLAWAAMMFRDQIDVAPGSWLWMPRAGVAAGVTLLVMGLAAKVDMLSYLPAALAGFGAVFGAIMVRIMELDLGQRLTGMHLYNPFFQVSISMVGGVLIAWLSVKLADSLSKK